MRRVIVQGCCCFKKLDAFLRDEPVGVSAKTIEAGQRRSRPVHTRGQTKIVIFRHALVGQSYLFNLLANSLPFLDNPASRVLVLCIL